MTIVADKLASNSVTTEKLAARSATLDKLAIHAITDNLWPNGNSESPAPAGADLSTAEFGWGSNSGAYAGTWCRARTNSTGALETLGHSLPCSPGDVFYIEAQCLVDVAGGAGVHMQFLDVFGGHLAYGTGSDHAAQTNSYAKVSYSGTAPANAVTCRFYLYVNPGRSAKWDAIYARRKIAGSVLDVESIHVDRMTLGSTVLEEAWFAESRAATATIHRANAGNPAAGTVVQSCGVASTEIVTVAGHPALQINWEAGVFDDSNYSAVVTMYDRFALTQIWTTFQWFITAKTASVLVLSAVDFAGNYGNPGNFTWAIDVVAMRRRLDV